MSTETDPVISYGYAKENGVILLAPASEGEVLRLGIREGARPRAVIEATAPTALTPPS